MTSESQTPSVGLVTGICGATLDVVQQQGESGCMTGNDPWPHDLCIPPATPGQLLREGVGQGLACAATPARHPASQRFHELLKEIGELHDQKQASYGKPGDPFANVRSSADWGMPAWVGAMVRATDKVKRLQTLATRGTLTCEPARDAFKDLAVYALIGLVLFDEETKKSERDKGIDALAGLKW